MADLRGGESVEMKGSGAKPYVLKNVGGVYSCTCPAWRNQSTAIERRTCKHLRKLRGDAAEDVGAEWLAADVTDADCVERIVATATEQLGALDVLVNNAGTSRNVPLDELTEALAAAAREALRNAARHAGSPIFVFAQASPDGAEVFVRDEGPGFELASVPTERRGVRDSILGRMTAVGGSAVVDSVPGEGTEVALRIGVSS